MADGAGQKTAGAAGGVEERLSRLRIDLLDHKGGDRARRIIFARIAGGLQVVQDLLIDVAEMLALGQVVEVYAIDLVDHLAHQLTGLHVVVGILEHIAHDAAPVARLIRDRQLLECRKEIAIDEAEQLLAGDALRISRPAPPLQVLRDRRAVVILQKLQLLVLIIDDLQEKHPAELADALGVAVNASVLAHDVLYGFDKGADGHGSISRPRHKQPFLHRRCELHFVSFEEWM